MLAIAKALRRITFREIPPALFISVGVIMLGSVGAGVFFGAKILFLGIIACFAALLCILIMRKPWIGMVAVAFALPFERVGAIDISGLTLRSSQVLTVVTLIATLFHVLLKKIHIRRLGVLMPLSIFFIGAAVALPQAVNGFRGMTSLFFMAFTLSLVVMIPTLIDSQKKLQVVLQALLLGAIFTSLFGIFQFLGDLAGLPPSLTGLRDLYTKEVFGFPRIQSTALEPLYFANYLLLPLAIAFVVIVRRLKALLPYALVLLPIGLPVFVLTLSRAAYIAAALMFLIIIIVLFRHIIKPQYIILFCLLALVTSYAVVWGLSQTGDEDVNIQAFTRQATGLFIGASYADRVQTTEQAMTLFSQHPLGIGPGNFGPAVALHPLVEPKGGWRIVNNIYIEVLTEEGVIGLIGLIATVIFVFVALGVSYVRAHDVWTRALLIAFAAALAGIFLQYTTFSVLYIMHIWFAVGLALSVVRLNPKTP